MRTPCAWRNRQAAAPAELPRRRRDAALPAHEPATGEAIARVCEPTHPSAGGPPQGLLEGQGGPLRRDFHAHAQAWQVTRNGDPDPMPAYTKSGATLPQRAAAKMTVARPRPIWLSPADLDGGADAF